MAKILLLKLDSGEEIIGQEKTGEGIENVYLANVRTLAIQPLGNNQAGVAMIPWMIGNPDGTISIPRMKVTGWPTEPTPKHIEDAYLQQVTGLSLATGNSGLQL